MATNTYQCTVCKRQVERVENIHGLDILSKCLITNGCRGKLHKIGRNLDNIRESFPKYEVDLQDYVARKAFTKHQQDIESKTWIIPHNLDCEPAIVVSVADASGIYTALLRSDYTTTTISRNVTKLTFSDATKGIAQLSARSSGVTPAKVVYSDSITCVTVDGTFIFAVPKFLTKEDYPSGVTLPMDLKNPIGDLKVEVIIERPNLEPIHCYEKLDGMFDLTPWSGMEEIMVGKRKHFYLKTKNILNFSTFNNPDLQYTDIPEGTRLFFTVIDYGTGISQPIESKDLLLLLSTAEGNDKVRNKLLDVGEMASVGGYLTYSKGEFYIDSKHVEKTYPPIEAARNIGSVPPLPSPTPTPTVTPTISVTPTNTVTPTPTRTVTPTVTPTISDTPTPTPTISDTPTPTPTISDTPTPTPTVTPTISDTPTPTPSPA